jgi:uncharacterized phage protein (TIGR02216 family)
MIQTFGAAAERLSGAAAMLLGWRPDEFWTAPPRELAAALGGVAGEGADAPERSEIEALMARFPDGGGQLNG